MLATGADLQYGNHRRVRILQHHCVLVVIQQPFIQMLLLPPVRLKDGLICEDVVVGRELNALVLEFATEVLEVGELVKGLDGSGVALAPKLEALQKLDVVFLFFCICVLVLIQNNQSSLQPFVTLEGVLDFPNNLFDGRLAVQVQSNENVPPPH